MDYDFPKEIPPGIITSTLELKSKENSYILSVDGKKLAPGLNENSGDQDLFHSFLRVKHLSCCLK
jgi:hypothetical protein